MKAIHMCLVLSHFFLGVSAQAWHYRPGEWIQRAFEKAAFTEHASMSHELRALAKELVLLRDPSKILTIALGTSAGVSNLCANQTVYILDNLKSKWGLQMLDSWGKPEAGLMQGNIAWLGNYDECVNITVNTNGATAEDISMKYCSVRIPVPSPIPNAALSIGVCVANGCSEKDVMAFFDSVIGPLMSRLNMTISTRASCQPLVSDRTFGAAPTAMFVIVILMITICGVATIYEIGMTLANNLFTCGSDIVDADENTPLLGKIVSLQQSESMFVKVVMAFSLYSNGKKVLSTEQPPGVIGCLNGIRFFSMSWVIMGHTLVAYILGRARNTVWILELTKRWTFEPILNSTVSVDSFFIISGFLVAYLFLRDFTKRKIQLKEFLKALPLIYFQRYFRLTPALAFSIMIYGGLWYYLWDGPLWPNDPQYPQMFDQYCADKWYRNVLYINNLFNSSEQCALWTWYLANDFQFFVVAPFVVFLFYIHAVAGMVLAILMVLGSIVAAFFVADSQHDTLLGLGGGGPGFGRTNFQPPAVPPVLQEYFVPWARYQTYGIGIIAGLVFFKLKQAKYQIPQILNLLLWGLSGAVCLSVLYGTYDANTGGHLVTLTEADFFNGIARSAWGMGLSYMIVACALGQGGWINDFLSWKGFTFISKLTYCAYLIHIPILTLFLAGSRSTQIYNEMAMVQDVIFFVTIALVAAFPFSLVFEVPFTNLDKLFLSPRSIKSAHRDLSDSKLVNSDSEAAPGDQRSKVIVY